MAKTGFIILLATTICIFDITSSLASDQTSSPDMCEKTEPKIVNIINFIRLCEPREASITEKVLYETVAKQIQVMQDNNLNGTFLLQYDALLDTRYQELLKSLPADFEIGAWWEIPQPLVENSGMQWRGRFPWDWHADVGFSTGYTPLEREKLVDTYMHDFKQIFGYYPKSVGSWFIDAHTLNYMYSKYGIIASCNCKDQVGTDGYTLWGGYWNQAYYPSKVNSYMPAQNIENQIPVPIFRMLGSDPVRQYDTGIGSGMQGVITLEPVYSDAGGSETWTDWYLNEFVSGEAIEFAYTQAGQENSFTWSAMAKGFEYQMTLIAKLRDMGNIRVETLAESGQWFNNHYKTTPATSVTVNNDLPGSDLKTVWYNCRNYRTNIIWENDTLRIRDLHLFDENVKSDYLTERANSNECKFYTLPVVDGYLWSTSDHLAGLRLKAVIDGKDIILKGTAPTITSSQKGFLDINWPLSELDGKILIQLTENNINIQLSSANQIEWYFEFSAAPQSRLPYTNIEPYEITCVFNMNKYALHSEKGMFIKTDDNRSYRILPQKNCISLKTKLPVLVK